MAGDIMAQQVVEVKGFENHDFSRTARLAAFGGFIAGPSVALWYPFLQRTINIKSAPQALVARVAADQLIFAPTFIGIFFAYNGIMEGKSINEVKEKLSQRTNQQLESLARGATREFCDSAIIIP
ncbi:Protein required for ethanol metabolism [Blyttiomyces sp. JEL0837]|nr:Protein required for ethanol metabolism [Blyttiomyces sp. JEL0837]